jgi:hypothetical protein
MSHMLISVSDEEIQSKPVTTAFDEKLRRALSDQAGIIAISLHPELGCGTDMLEWLETWQDKFIKVKKQFFIVPGNVNQMECLEVSHPDQELKYIPTIEDLETLLASLAPEVSEAVLEVRMPETAPAPVPADRSKPVQPSQSLPAAADQSAAGEDAETFEVKISKKEPDVSTPPILMDVSQLVETSGEYKCLGCSTTRMWLKGDITTECTNPECADQDAGWEMTYELF